MSIEGFSSKIKYINSRFSLGIKMTAFTIMVGTVTWLFLDHFQSIELSLLFRHQIDETLSKQSHIDRSLLDAYIRSYGKAASLIIAQNKFVKYTEQQDLLHKNNESPLRHEIQPPWLPKNSIMRTFPLTPHILLTDNKGQLLESYSISGLAFPQQLIENSRLQQLSNDQTLLTKINDTPFILASAHIYDEVNNRNGTLMVASALDNNFLHSAVSIIAPDSMVALVDNKTNKIISSNAPENIKKGSKLSTIEQSYHITGKSFFDYGSSDLELKFISLLPRSTYNQIATRILLTNRINGLILCISLIISFLMVIYWITTQVYDLTRQVTTFSNKHLGATSQENGQGDQLNILKIRFEHFISEIIRAQNKIKMQAEENLLLTQDRYEAEQRGNILYLLQTITEILGLGIITYEEGKGPLPANREMEKFIFDYGDIDCFAQGGIGTFEIELKNRTNTSHIFQIYTRYFSAKQKITLVQDITKKKHYENEREKLISELTDALDKVNTLSGFLPICSSCKKIRDDQGSWYQLESYLKTHSDLEFSHSICPSCASSLYGDMDK
ncbi:MAG: hypothetical protein OEM02_08250 [Desulfobulbaceae bacterium]|nr:hypothetical protein [Desulfobulbaceae bacterium]